MAKKRLFGNSPEPRCETCAHGKSTPEGDVVLCKRAGAVSPEHHCRRFQYDPLKRTPRRSKPLDTFDEAAFSLDIDNEPTPVETDTAATEETASAPVIAEDTAAQETAAAVDTPEHPTANASDASSEVLIPDDSADIFDDLARLNVELIKSATYAAFRDFDPKMISREDYETNDLTQSDESSDNEADPLLFEVGGEDEADLLTSDDLILIDTRSFSEDNTEMLAMDEEGNISAVPNE